MLLLYYLGAIGEPNVSQKLIILHSNLVHLAQQKEITGIDLVVNVYSASQAIQRMILSWGWKSSELDAPSNVTFDGTNVTIAEKAAEGKGTEGESPKKKFRNVFFHVEKGVLAELWHTNKFHDRVEAQGYTSVLFTLDDVELLSFPVCKSLEAMEKHQLTILSPRVSNATHKWLMTQFPGLPENVRWSPELELELEKKRGTAEEQKNQRSVNLKLANMCEWYAYLMPPSAFMKLMALHSVENPGCWGVDIVLGKAGFLVGIWAEAHCHHHFAGKLAATKGLDFNAHKLSTDMNRFLNKMGFRDMQDAMKKWPPVKKQVTYI
jgi:hypothetical protein